MPSVLLTRPQQDSERLALALADFGYDGVIEPLLTLKPTYDIPPAITNLQAIMITSAHALDFLDAHSHGVTELLNHPCFCVGNATADKATSFGFTNVHDADGDGLDLAQHIQQTLATSKGTILHIAGQDIDSRSRFALIQKGFLVANWTTYIAETSATLSATSVRMFRERAIDAVLLFSSRTAETLKKLIIQHGLETCCENVIAIGISDMVVKVIDDLPWRRLDAASSPNEDSLLQCLKDNLPEAS